MVAKAKRAHSTEKLNSAVLVVTAIFAICALSSSVGSQGVNLSDPVELLTGGDQREWINEKWKIVLNDPEGDCLSGKSWVFKQNGAGSHSECRNGQREASPFHWSLEAETKSDDTHFLFIDSEKYKLEFAELEPVVPDATPIIVAIIRTLAPDQRTPIKEITIEYWER